MKTGDIVTMGAWPQGADQEAREPLAWRVLEVRDGAALLLCDRAIAYQMYHEAFKPVTWHSCTLRRWMNGEFLDACFTEEEKARIVPTDTAKDTQDSVFCLSRDEVEDLLPDRLAQPTEHANLYGTYIRCEYARWWLRSRGNTPLMALVVGDNSVIFSLGVALKSVAVRPAIRVKAE